MRFASILVAAIGVVVAFVSAGTALGTALCEEKLDKCPSSPGATYPAGTTVEATSSNAVFKGNVVEECESSTVKMTTAAEVGKPLGSELVQLNFSGSCEPCESVTVEKLPHTASLEASGGGKGTLTTAVQVAFSQCPFGVNCVYGAKTVSLDTTSKPGALIAKEEELTRKLGNESVCGASEKWSGEYVIGLPKPLWISNTASGTALCQEETEECPPAEMSWYPAGTTIKATSKSPKLLGSLPVTCEASAVEIVTSAKSGAPLGAQLVSMTLTGCTGCTSALAAGLPAPVEIEASGKGLGTFVLKGGQVTFTGCPFGIKCTATMTGSSMKASSEPASLVAKEVSWSLSGGLCGTSGKWDAEYEITAPSPIWLSTSP